jgi:hypothetical protein
MTVVFLLLLFLAPAAAQTSSRWRPNLDVPGIGPALKDLRPAEKLILDEGIELIGQGEHARALVVLSQLTESNPKNTPFRVIKAYALLQLGNLIGALGEARAAEGAKPHSAYRCWFLARVAFLAGNRSLCEREIGHVAGHPIYGPEAAKLKEELRARR